MDVSREIDSREFLRLLYRKKLPFLVCAALVSLSIVIGGYLLPKTYEAKSVMMIENNVLNELIKTVTVTSPLDDKVKALGVVMKSRSLLSKVVEDLGPGPDGRKMDVEAAIAKFQEHTDIKIEVNRSTQRDMDVFIVSYTDSNPQFAANYVNALIRRYVEENTTLKREEAYGANKFLHDQITSFKVKLDRLESSIARQRSARTTPERSTLLSERLEQLIRKRDELMVQYTENYPEVIRIKGEIELLKAQMRNSSSQQSAVDQGLLDLERERETTKKIYEDLLATLRKSEVSTEVEVQDKAGVFRILDPAIVPTRPQSPKMMRVILLAIAAGFGAAAGLLMVIDKLDPSIKSVRTIRRLGLPVLAVISTMRTERENAASRRRDGMIYAAACIYLTVLLSIAGIEALGLGYVDRFIQGSKAEIGTTLRKIWNKQPAAASTGSFSGTRGSMHEQG